MKAPSPYLTADEAAVYLRFDTTAPTDPVKAFHQWRYRHGSRIKTYRRGSTTLYKQIELDAAVSGLRRVS